MKLTILLTAVVFFQVQAADSLAQSVSISGRNMTLKQVFSAIEKQTGYVLLNTKGTFDGSQSVSFTVHKMPLREFLGFLLKEQQLEYEIQGKTILLSRKPARAPDPVNSLPGRLFPEKDPVIGIVLNEDGAPLSGVSVFVKRTNKGAVTDASGKFTVQAEKGDIISVSFVGYANQEVKVAGATVFIKMKISASVLDESQITAYGKTSRRLATGNIGTVKGDEIERQPVMTVLEALIGKVPGLTIQPTTGNSAAPVRVNIRGINTISQTAITDPLYVIDGIPFTILNASSITGNSPISMGAVQAGLPNLPGENPMLGINLKDIESVSVLKDADATAIYGSRGANGVILITTKRPKTGPTRFNFSVKQGTTMIPSYPKLLNTRDYLQMRREAFRNDGLIPDLSNAPDLVSWDSTKYTDWQRMFIGTGSVTTIDAGVSGGMQQTSYFLSAGFTTRKELMNNGGKNSRGTFRTGFNHTSSDQKFGFNLSNNIAFTEVNTSLLGDLGGIAPNAPDVYNEKGEFNFEPYRVLNGSIFEFSNLKKNSESNTFSLQSSMTIKYEIVRGLNISTNAGYQFSNNRNASYTPQAANDPFFDPVSSAWFGNSINKSWTVEPQLQYNTFIGKGNLSVQLIANMQSVNTRGETIDAKQFPNDALMKSYNNATSKNITEGYREFKSVSGAAIVRYTWDNKYVLNINARRDGSSRFGPGKQFGNFGSVGVAWVASDEKWIGKIMPSWFNFLKFRGSYGITGADNIGDYEYLSRWSRSPTITDQRLLFRYNGIDVFNVVRPFNQSFQWESTSQSELGATLAFLQNRITLELAVYRKVSGNQLTSLPTPIFTGFSSVYANSEARISNTGIEASLAAKLISSKDWSLDVNFNISHNRNKLLAFPNLEKSAYRERMKVGESINTRYYLKFTGIDPVTGNATFEDRNKDGLITIGSGFYPDSDTDDRYIALDYTNPKFTGGFNINFSYKSLSVFSGFMFMKKFRPHPYFTAMPGAQMNINIPDDVKYNHWQQPGDQAKYPRYTTNGSSIENLASSDAYFVNGSFLRMTNLALAWEIPDKWISKIGMKGANFSIQTQNLFTISPYRGLDPDLFSGINVTPIPRTITTSLSFNF